MPIALRPYSPWGLTGLTTARCYGKPVPADPEERRFRIEELGRRDKPVNHRFGDTSNTPPARRTEDLEKFVNSLHETIGKKGE